MTPITDRLRIEGPDNQGYYMIAIESGNFGRRDSELLRPAEAAALVAALTPTPTTGEEAVSGGCTCGLLPYGDGISARDIHCDVHGELYPVPADDLCPACGGATKANRPFIPCRDRWHLEPEPHPQRVIATDTVTGVQRETVQGADARAEGPTTDAFDDVIADGGLPEARTFYAEERIRVLERAVGNCFMMAKRQIAAHLNGTSTAARDLERWQHIQRFCETTGSKSDILRGQLPTEITEGSTPVAAPGAEDATSTCARHEGFALQVEGACIACELEELEQFRLGASAPAAGSAPAWQPINTAPGEESVLVSDGLYVVFGYRWDNRRPRVWTYNDDGSKLRPQPTHWMPIPSAPVDPAQET